MLLVVVVLGACAREIACPADLSRAVDEHCECPVWAVKRPVPVALPDGALDYCAEEPSPDGASTGLEPTDGRVPPSGVGRDSTATSDGGPVDGGVTSPPSVASGRDAGTGGSVSASSTDAAVSPPPACAPAEERCDQSDNDCDGVIDEQLSCAQSQAPSSCTATFWYRDCDGDGYAASRAGSASGCTAPPAPSQCRGWTNREPTGGQVDCDDNSIIYAPGADFGTAGFGNGDLNCDGVIERRAQPTAAPMQVERRPRDDAQFCRYDAEQRLSDCECFQWDPWLWKGEEQPPCATTLTETIEASYIAWDGIEPNRRCRVAVTVATMSIDSYRVRQTCR